MKIIQMIKELFRIQTVKKIEAPKEISKIKNEETKIIQYKPEEKISKHQQISDILRIIGLDKETVLKVSKIENLDKDNMKKNLKILSDLGYSKLQMSLIISGNIETLTLPNDIIVNSIEELNNYIKDKDVAKNIIYSNPLVLCESIKEKIEHIRETLEKVGFDEESQRYILEENSNIFSLKHERFVESLTIIREYYEDKEKFLEEIINNPLIIGIIDKKVLAANY